MVIASSAGTGRLDASCGARMTRSGETAVGMPLLRRRSREVRATRSSSSRRSRVLYAIEMRSQRADA
eukprot:scaffold1640_cov111-Isochrysis_galbana.AAC.18